LPRAGTDCRDHPRRKENRFDIELRLHRSVTGDRKIHLAEPFRFAASVLMLGEDRHRLHEASTTQPEVRNPRESHLASLRWQASESWRPGYLPRPKPEASK